MKTLEDKLRAFFGMQPWGNCQVTGDAYFIRQVAKDYSATDINAMCKQLGQREFATEQP